MPLLKPRPVKTVAIVADTDLQLPSLKTRSHTRRGRLAVPRDVGERLLRHTEDSLAGLFRSGCLHLPPDRSRPPAVLSQPLAAREAPLPDRALSVEWA
jgi:hypothetical protein